MIYRSTRSLREVSDCEAVVEGLSPDGGLYMAPELLNCTFDWRTCIGKKPYDIAADVLSFLLPSFENSDEIIEKAYSKKFDTKDITPLVKVGDKWVLELFHGPTLAFKDVALSVLPILMSEAKKKLKKTEHTVILTATSGDTGKAALEGFRDADGISIAVFYPDGGVSPVQRAQMVTQEGENVRVCAVKGNFDDCQTAVKKIFRETKNESLSGISLSSANSINIGRLVPQVSYYFIAYSKLCESGAISIGDKVDFSVPTGNFGDILAGYIAKKMGLPVGKLICASNRNNVLSDFLQTGVYDKNRPFYLTSSPSMDILVSSNLERLLSYETGCDPDTVKGYMESLDITGKFKVDEDVLKSIKETFTGCWISEQETASVIKKVWDENHYLIDTHTAVAYGASCKIKSGNPVVVLSTASPYKFTAAVMDALSLPHCGNPYRDMESLEKETGVRIPENLRDLELKPERFSDVRKAEELKDYVKEFIEDRR